MQFRDRDCTGALFTPQGKPSKQMSKSNIVIGVEISPLSVLGVRMNRCKKDFRIDKHDESTSPLLFTLGEISMDPVRLDDLKCVVS